MDCRHHEAEITRLRAELAHERSRADRLAAMLEQSMETARVQAEAVVTLASNARGVAVTRDSVTGTVTLMEKKEKIREQGRVRSQNFRHRHRNGSLPLSDGAPSVTASPSSSASRGEGQGNLRVVTQAARYGATAPPRVIRRPEQLPEPVRELRQAWNDQVVPHGFPAWGDTSAKLLEEARAALQRRPLEDWRRVFELVPRSNVCRGELSSRIRYTVVRVLGYTTQGEEVAACLLEGAWSIDAPQPEPKPEPFEVIDVSHLAEGPEGEAALRTWQLVLDQLRTEGRRVSLENFEKCGLAPVAVQGGALVLMSVDKYAPGWVGDQYGESLNQRLASLGLEEGVIVTSPEGVQWPEEIEALPDEPGAAPPGAR